MSSGLLQKARMIMLIRAALVVLLNTVLIDAAWCQAVNQGAIHEEADPVTVGHHEKPGDKPTKAAAADPTARSSRS